MRFYLHARHSPRHTRPLIGQASNRHDAIVANTHPAKDSGRRARRRAIPRKPARSEEHRGDRLAGFRRQSLTIDLDGEPLRQVCGIGLWHAVFLERER
jgi:hypothetical protein